MQYDTCTQPEPTSFLTHKRYRPHEHCVNTLNICTKTYSNHCCDMTNPNCEAVVNEKRNRTNCLWYSVPKHVPKHRGSIGVGIPGNPRYIHRPENNFSSSYIVLKFARSLAQVIYAKVNNLNEHLKINIYFN